MVKRWRSSHSNRSDVWFEDLNETPPPPGRPVAVGGGWTWMVEAGAGPRADAWRVTVLDGAGQVIWDHPNAVFKSDWPTPEAWLWSHEPEGLTQRLLNQWRKNIWERLKQTRVDKG